MTEPMTVEQALAAVRASKFDVEVGVDGLWRMAGERDAMQAVAFLLRELPREIATLATQVEAMRGEVAIRREDYAALTALFVADEAKYRARAEAAERDAEALRRAGQILANMAYNFAQSPALPSQDREALDYARKTWDAAIDAHLADREGA